MQSLPCARTETQEKTCVWSCYETRADYGTTWADTSEAAPTEQARKIACCGKKYWESITILLIRMR